MNSIHQMEIRMKSFSKCLSIECIKVGVSRQTITTVPALCLCIGLALAGTAVAQGMKAASPGTASPSAAPQISASGTHTCVTQVSTASRAGTGTMSLGNDVAVNGPTAPSDCHAQARTRFAANRDWSDPKRVCARYPGVGVVRVMASDYFRDLGNKGGVNHVESYKVDCGGPPTWDHSLHVVGSTL
jgi:hypothetical protein